jgi:queuine tRNA-ribosyltransferase
MLGPILLTWHNLQVYQDLMRDLRAAIETGTLAGFAEGFLSKLGEGDIPAL